MTSLALPSMSHLFYKIILFYPSKFYASPLNLNYFYALNKNFMARFIKLILILEMCFSSMCFMIFSPAFSANSIQWHKVFFWLSKFCWVGQIVLVLWLVLSLVFLWPHPHPNLITLCVLHLDAYPLSKIYLLWKAQKTCGLPRWFFSFLKFWSVFFEIWCLFYSFIYYYSLLLLFVSLDNVPFLTRCKMI